MMLEVPKLALVLKQVAKDHGVFRDDGSWGTDGDSITHPVPGTTFSEWPKGSMRTVAITTVEYMSILREFDAKKPFPEGACVWKRDTSLESNNCWWNVRLPPRSLTK